MAENRRGHSADTRLNENVRRYCLHLSKGFAHHDRIALHDQTGNPLVAGPGRVGNGQPSSFCANSSGLLDAVIVRSFDTNDLRAEPSNRVYPLLTDARMHEDYRTGTDKLSSLRDRTAVIAIRRASHGHCPRHGKDFG